ncbi:Regulatory protein BlaR1 [Planctomycetes bacterium Pla163]|uniref:Regulatory protein BlaR1 n=1 Tax=Rohdeia mirabilis TaxID=2528008 RepID=A0A518CV21_9BACT|nr:Regulatory protein BlaR1 [Planctomycetes bacterium Pla163]
MSSETITWWNVAAADGLDWAWRAGLASLAVLAVLLIARPLLKRRLSAHAASWLWLLPLVPLVAPPVAVAGWVDPFPELPLELAARADESDAPTVGATRTAALDASSRSADDGTPGEVVADEPARATGAASGRELALEGAAAGDAGARALQADQAHSGSDAANDSESGAANDGTLGSTNGVHSPFARSNAAAVELRAATWGVLVWLAVALAGVALVLVRLARTAALVRRATGRPAAELAARFDTLARHAGLDRRVDLRLTDELESPATTGFVRATVLVPASLATELDAPALDWILRHELAHVRRRDVLVSTLVHLVRALWPLHPAVWLAPLFAERERELACDEAALAREPRADGPRAAKTLLHVLERRRSSHALATGAVPLAHPESLERRRIMKLLDPAVRASRGLSPFSALGLVVAGVGLLGSGLRPVDVPTPRVEALATDAAGSQIEAAAPVEVVALDPAPFVPAERSTAESRAEVMASAAAYLIEQQRFDGSWAATTDAGADPPKGYVRELNDPGATGLVMLALSQAPDTTPGRDQALRLGMAWLTSRFDSETGSFASSTDGPQVVQSHTFALRGWLAANEALDPVEGRDGRIAIAQRAVEFLVDARTTLGGWECAPNLESCQAQTTAWVLCALVEARDLGLTVGVREVDGGFGYLMTCFDPETGRTGFWPDIGGGLTSARYERSVDSHPPELVETHTAQAIAARLQWGRGTADDDGLILGSERLVEALPKWSIEEGSIDIYYWQAGTEAIQSFGASKAALWNQAIETALVPNHATDANGNAYWPAVGAWHVAGTEVPMTAWCLLTLQALPEGVPHASETQQPAPGESGARSSESRTPERRTPDAPTREPQTPDRHTVVASALEYLLANQSDDGRWRASTKDDAKAAAGEFDDVGVTANAILALLDAPAGFEFPGRERALSRAIAWLADQQDDETGAFILSGPSWYTNPSHARALTAWIAYHTSELAPQDSEAWLATARAAVDFCARARNPYQGWRYDYPPAGDNDSVVTGWMLSALAAARDVGLEVGREEQRGGFAVLDENFDPATGRVGYIGCGTATSRIGKKKDDFPGDAVEFPTAVALCAYRDWGVDLVEVDEHIASLALLASKPPRWSRGEGTTDSYYWAFGTDAIQVLGGALAERWNRRLESALLEHFDRDANGRAYWAAVDAWHDAGSEVAMTAMCVLALQAIEESGSDH